MSTGMKPLFRQTFEDNEKAEAWLKRKNIPPLTSRYPLVEYANRIYDNNIRINQIREELQEEVIKRCGYLPEYW